MIEIFPATSDHLSTIKNLAYRIWPATYDEILSEKQLAYMLELFYNEKALQQNINDNHNFILIQENDEIVGFADYELHYKKEYTTRIHKIYLLPETQGKGLGKKLIQFIKNKALENDNIKLSLNVNRFNKAKGFYESQSFKIAFEEDVELDFGYLMEDYRMEKLLK
ncbi:GNAT family N-acetyltransferase [Flavobacterium antarcticum]|uniref:GNAT family N-acetyltransferase n=1 Tax=Flavobacterium antarcticum TaxID=271155 RepID=UPI0003B584C1|nr:GNAT family N-acetyltransferase [Flavobacterium antarcticum]